MVRKRFYAKIILIIFFIAILSFYFTYSEKHEKQAETLQTETPQSERDCIIEKESKIVNGISMEPIISDRQEVTILKGYYSCNPVERNDIIIYSYAGNKNPLIKIVKGIPEDTFELRKTGSSWNIIINDEILMNSQDTPYLLDKREYGILSLYEKEYKGIIPGNTYLLMGNLAEGSLDSTRFGLIDKKDIIGKVVY
ncbi:MAG: signal peptidase I [Candidatus Aenigmarchaeota archaeon]|nr:signal peptidase I [Candidatus Aenigmarchaeota archaeon]